MGKNRLVFLVVSTALGLFLLITAFTGPLPTLYQRGILVALAGTLLILKRPLGKSKLHTLLDGLATASIVLPCLNLMINFDRIISSPTNPTMMDKILGIFFILGVLELGRRAAGSILSLFGVALLAYVILGKYIPGHWGHPGYSIDWLVSNAYMSTTGIFGSLTALTATGLGLIIIFGAILSVTGSGIAFVQIALSLFGRIRGGPALVATAASALFGTISGSALANAASIGIVTIPLMKKVGYTREFAGAVEATASSGGQIMPPIMASAAFIMAEFLGVPYFEVAARAALPAVLYYLALWLQIMIVAQRRNLAPAPGDMPRFWDAVLKFEVLSVFVSIGVFFALQAVGFSLGYAAFWAVLIGVTLSMIWNFVGQHRGKKGAIRLCRELALGQGDSLAMIGGIVVIAQLIISLFNLTGLGIKLADVIFSLGQENILFGLFLAMVICLVLGMGVPTVAAYLLTVAICLPPLMRLGTLPFAVHIFVLYYAVLSCITPPVCPAVFVAASIASGDWFKTSLIAMRLAVAGFFVPYIIVFHHGLILMEPLPVIVHDFMLAIIVFFTMGTLSERWIFGRMDAPQILLIMSALILVLATVFWPGLTGVNALLLELVAVVLVVGVTIYNRMQYKRAPPVLAP